MAMLSWASALFLNASFFLFFFIFVRILLYIKWINPIIYQPQRADIAQNMIEMELYDFETGKI
jgi:hypothetical protein